MTTPSRKARILIIDDERDLCTLLADFLNFKGYDAAVATSGEEGLEKLHRSRFQLVVSDIRMPKMGGLQVLERIKQLDPSIEVVLVTAYANVPAAVEALKLGAFDFIEKPFSLEKVVKIIDSALERRELKTVGGLEAAAQAVFSTLKLQELLPKLADLALTVAPAEDAFIALSRGSRMELAAIRGLDGPPPAPTRLLAAEALARAGEPSRTLAVRPDQDPRFSGIPGIENVRFLLGYPMPSQDGVQGVLGLCRTRGEDPFTAAETRNFSLFAALVAEAVRAAMLYDDLERKIDELKRAEARAIQSEKMAGLGRIASGLAHELRNPLTGVLCNIQILLEALKDPAQAEIGRDIEECARRCNEVIESLLTYSRAGRLELAPHSVSELIDAALSHLQKDRALRGIQVQREAAGLPAVMVNTVQMRQVIYNLFLNAAQAMPSGGMLSLRGRVLKVSRDTLKLWASPGASGAVPDLGAHVPHQGEEFVVLEVKDEGHGIEAKDLPLIFEPFFTTKEPGRGTGLGLYLSYEIVSANGGILWASSPGRGRGSTFFLALPAAPEAHARAAAKHPAERKTEAMTPPPAVADSPRAARAAPAKD